MDVHFTYQSQQVVLLVNCTAHSNQAYFILLFVFLISTVQPLHWPGAPTFLFLVQYRSTIPNQALMKHGTFSTQTAAVVTETTGAWAGAAAGDMGGAKGGAIVGAMIGGPAGAAVGAVARGVVGAVGGAIAGSSLGKTISGWLGW